MPSLISFLSKQDQNALLDNLNYLNMEEIQRFCKTHSIPYKITFEDADGKIKLTNEKDRKGIILTRIRSFLKTGKVPPATCFRKSIVRLPAEVSKTLKANSRIYFGHYDKKNKAMIGLLKKLTDNKFKDGAVARILIREFWSDGIAPTYQQFAKLWQQAIAERKKPNPEWAFLADLAAGKDIDDWKTTRNKVAKSVIKILNQISPQ